MENLLGKMASQVGGVVHHLFTMKKVEVDMDQEMANLLQVAEMLLMKKMEIAEDQEIADLQKNETLLSLRL